jgi:hypothetical protein
MEPAHFPCAWKLERDMTSRRTVKAFAAVAAALFGAACGGDDTSPTTATTAGPTTTTVPEQPKQLILFEQSPIPAEALAAQHEELDQLPFDGVFFTIEASSEIQRPTRLGLETLRAQLAPLAGVEFENLQHNFLLVYATPAGAFSDYGPVVQNFADLAQAAGEVGIEGIFFDNEEYFGPAWHPDVSCPGIDLEACREQARVVGAEVMTAMSTRWPEVEVLNSSGAWLSEDDTYDHLKDMGYNDIAFANTVWGSFAVGMFEAASGADGTYIDGGGVYTQRDAADLEIAYNWFRYGMARESDIIPDELRATYEKNLEIAFGIYDFPELYRGKVSDASVWQRDITDALRASDRYVWAYTERYNWTNNPLNPKKPVVPVEYLEATSAGREAAKSGTGEG